MVILRCLVGFFAIAVSTMVGLTPGADAEELTAAKCMQLDESSRTMYFIGAWDGAIAMGKAIGVEISPKEALTYQQGSEKVYRRLLREPEIDRALLSRFYFRRLNLL
jgi:hypothetical protein